MPARLGALYLSRGPNAVLHVIGAQQDGLRRNGAPGIHLALRLADKIADRHHTGSLGQKLRAQLAEFLLRQQHASLVPLQWNGAEIDIDHFAADGAEERDGGEEGPSPNDDHIRTRAIVKQRLPSRAEPLNRVLI